MIRVLVAGKYQDAISKVTTLAQSLPQEIQILDTAMDEQAAMELIDSKLPDVVVIALDTGDTEMIQVARKIYVYKPRIITCVYGHNMDSNLYSQLLNSGVRSAGEYPTDPQAFLVSLKSLLEVESTRAGYLSNTHSALLTSSTVIGFYSPKAGAGTTTCAVNTAVGLARRGKKVILVDLDLEFGDAHTYLDLKPRKSIADLCSEFNRDTFSISDIESYCGLHTSGVYILSAPKSPEYAERVTAEQVGYILSTVKVFFEYIIVDMPAGLSEKHANLLKYINRIYLVTPLQLSSVMAAKQAIGVLGILGRKESINVIANRTARMDLISLRDLHKILNCRVVAAIPSDYRACISAASRGMPIIVSMPHNAIAKAFNNIAIYTLSKDTTLDIWDMSASEIAKAYQKLEAKGPGKTEAVEEKKAAPLFRRHGRRQVNGGTA